ncbi:MAG: hypothetical protein ACI91F_001450, partial [Candidatus Binatia bacterium]
DSYLSQPATAYWPHGRAFRPDSDSEPRLQRSIALFVLGRLCAWPAGQVAVMLPDRSRQVFGDIVNGRRVAVEIHDWSFFGHALIGGYVGIGQSYRAGHWSSPDLVELCKMFAQHPGVIDGGLSWRRLATMLRSGLRNIRRGTRSSYEDSSRELCAARMGDFRRASGQAGLEVTAYG